MPLKQAKDIFEAGHKEALEWFQHEVGGLRSGRVKPDLVKDLVVEAYGTRTPLQAVASISNSDARTLLISPYDKNTIQTIEKAVTEANLGVMPIVDSQVIRLVFPSLTDEVRKQTTKLLHAKAEEARVRLRQTRDEALRLLRQEREQSVMNEDDFYLGRDELDRLITKASNDVAVVVTKKEQDIQAI